MVKAMESESSSTLNPFWATTESASVGSGILQMICVTSPDTIQRVHHAVTIFPGSTFIQELGEVLARQVSFMES